MLDELGNIEKELRISVKDAEMPRQIMDKESQNKLLAALTACPHGPIAWSKEMDDLVETSTNLASVKFVENNTSQDSYNTEKLDRFIEEGCGGNGRIMPQARRCNSRAFCRIPRMAA